jgi:alkanesulfonate monooxygenase SsuD/methylene tetrahydromethanopterin reductase-like flavin-dependent oxidoreductase (luciferase family)
MLCRIVFWHMERKGASVIYDTEFNSAAQVPAKICVDAAGLAEKRGFGAVWKGESNSRDPLVLLTAYAARTSRLGLGTAIYHVYGRSPVTLGIQAATLNEYADGRLLLGLGVANETIAAWHGDTYERPLRRIREYVDIVRATYSGERVEYEGDFYSSTRGFKLAFEPPSHPLRVMLAALSPQSARLAGKISDGVIINMANPARVREIVGWCNEGAESVGRDPAGFEVTAKLRVAIHEDAAHARRTLNKVLTFYALQNGYGQMLREMGFAEEVDRIRDVYAREGFHAARDQVSDDLFAGVPMFAGSSLDGLPERLEAYREAGVTRMIVACVPTADDLWSEIRHFLDAADFVGAPA